MFVISATSVRKCSLALPLGRVAQALSKPVAFFEDGVGKFMPILGTRTLLAWRLDQWALSLTTV